MNENKRFQKNGSCISEYNDKKNRTKKVWLDKGTELAGEFKKLCEAE